MNLEKLAQTVGVSLGTVSKAFSGSKEISESTKQKIFAVAKENGCFEKYYKGKREKKVIAVICPELESNYYCAIASRIESELNKRGAVMMLLLSSFSSKKEQELVNYLITSKSVDGIIIITAQSRVKFNENVPIVAVNTRRDLSEVDCINVAFKDTIIDTIAYLKENGHEKIAFMGDMFAKSKLNMFINAMQVNGLSVNQEWLFTEKVRFEDAGKSAMAKLLAMDEQPTAIFCSYDNIALGAIQSIRTHSKNVPDDYSIVGIDDIPIASHYNISLTSIKSRKNTICDTAVDLIMKKLESKFFSLHQKISLRTELIKRGSVKKIN